MARNADFQEDSPVTDIFLLNIDGYEGPIDVLLDMSRQQKVDLKHVSILQLVRQYLDFIDRARELNLDLAAEYLVMAAWLAYLKSRLLLPKIDDDNDSQPSGDDMAAALTYQLQRLEAMRDCADGLFSRPQLFRNFLRRYDLKGDAAPEAENRVENAADNHDHIDHIDHTNIIYDVGLFDLLSAYGQIHHRQSVSHYEPVTFDLMSAEQAMDLLTHILGELPRDQGGGKSIWLRWDQFLKDYFKGVKQAANMDEHNHNHNQQDRDLFRRSSLAASLLAGLELAKQGQLEMQQDGTNRPIYMRQIHRAKSSIPG